MTTMPPAVDHVVLVSLDTLRADALGMNPHNLWKQAYPKTRPPEAGILDRLAASGAFFANCITAAPYTSAAHASILTGLWPPRHGVYEFYNRRLAVPTVFRHARRLGFKTVMKVDFPVILGPELGFDEDVDSFIIEDDDAALAELRGARRSFSLLHFGGLHIPYGFHNLQYGGEEYRQKVKHLRAEYPLAAPLTDQMVETFRSSEDLSLLLEYKSVIQRLYHDREYERLFELYLEGVTWFLSNRFAPFLERLFTVLDGTRFVLVIFGDHGEEYSEESFGHFDSLAEGVLRVPVIFIGPDVQCATWTERIRTVDILPTLLDLIGGVPWRRRMDGETLAPSLLQRAAYAPRRAFAQCWITPVEQVIRFQRRAMDQGRKMGSLPHLKYRDAVYDGTLKLQRQHLDREGHHGDPYPIKPTLRLEEIAEDGVPRAIADEGAVRRLSALLEEYDLRRAGARRVESPPELRAHLQHMGYRV